MSTQPICQCEAYQKGPYLQVGLRVEVCSLTSGLSESRTSNSVEPFAAGSQGRSRCSKLASPDANASESEAFFTENEPSSQGK